MVNSSLPKSQRQAVGVPRHPGETSKKDYSTRNGPLVYVPPLILFKLFNLFMVKE